MSAENPRQDDKERSSTHTPEGYITNWGLAFRFIERARSDRFSGYSRWGGAEAMPQESKDRVWDQVVEEAKLNGEIRLLSEEEKLDMSVNDFVKRHPQT